MSVVALVAEGLSTKGRETVCWAQALAGLWLQPRSCYYMASVSDQARRSKIGSPNQTSGCFGCSFCARSRNDLNRES